ncbi:MAG: hypothetical protein LBH47_00095 [Christensenellaceae bacterium]|jgi:hypothetical protein|nr:hypothetical protein [Christensenellaceae bacterium]
MKKTTLNNLGKAVALATALNVAASCDNMYDPNWDVINDSYGKPTNIEFTLPANSQTDATNVISQGFQKLQAQTTEIISVCDKVIANIRTKSSLTYEDNQKVARYTKLKTMEQSLLRYLKKTNNVRYNWKYIQEINEDITSFIGEGIQNQKDAQLFLPFHNLLGIAIRNNTQINYMNETEKSASINELQTAKNNIDTIDPNRHIPNNYVALKSNLTRSLENIYPNDSKEIQPFLLQQHEDLHEFDGVLRDCQARSLEIDIPRGRSAEIGRSL